MKTITYNPETHVLVPREPSEEMIKAGKDVFCDPSDHSEEAASNDYRNVFKGMIAAAPQPEPVESEPVAYYSAHYKTPTCTKEFHGLAENPLPAGTKLYTTPQPGRVAELEAICKDHGEIQHSLCERIAELEAALKEAKDKLYGKTELLKSIRDVIDEARTYCEGPQWSPSMAEECKETLAKINEVLNDHGNIKD